MGVLSNQRVRVMTWTERNRLTFLTAMHVVDDLYQGAVPALLPFLALERHYSYAGLWRRGERRCGAGCLTITSG